MAFIDKIKTKESKEHKKAKVKLFNRLSNGRVSFINQFGNEIFITPTVTWTNLYMEAYSYKDDKNSDPYFGSPCLGCFCKTEEFKNNINYSKEYIFEDSIEYCLNERFKEKELTDIRVNNNNTYKQHPCIICKYKGELDCVAIFDIVCSLNGKYTVAIEIVKSSKCTDNKIKFCKENNIFLLEVNYLDVLNLNDNDSTLPCTSLWWYLKRTDGTAIKFKSV